MAGDLRLRHREAHVGEEAAFAALVDRALGLGVRLGGRCPDDVDPELLPQQGELGARHLAGKVAPSAAIRSRREGDPHPRGRRARGPQVRGRSRSEPAPGRGPDRPQGRLAQPPRHLAAPRASLRAEAADPRRGRRRRVVRLGEGVDRFAEGDEVVDQPGPRRGGQDRRRAHGRDARRAHRPPCGLRLSASGRPLVRGSRPRSLSSSRPPTGCSSRAPGCGRASGCSSGGSGAGSPPPRCRSPRRSARG